MTLLVSSEGPLCTASVLEQTTASQSTAGCIELHCREDLVRPSPCLHLWGQYYCIAYDMTAPSENECGIEVRVNGMGMAECLDPVMISPLRIAQFAIEEVGQVCS